MHKDWCEVDFGVDIDREGDPWRAWCVDNDYPSLAFPRLLGGTAGEECQAVEFNRKITKGDEIFAIASPMNL